MVGSVSDNGSIGAAAAAGTPGFLAELGQCGRWSEEEVETYVEATNNLLRVLGVLSGAPKTYKVTYLKKMAVAMAEQEGCWYAAKKLEETVKKGRSWVKSGISLAMLLGSTMRRRRGCCFM